MSANKGLSSRAIIGSFYKALALNPGAEWIGATSMLFNTDQESETYKWLGQVPVMREWIGGRQPKGFLENGITVANKLYEATLEVPVDWMRRDKTGQIMVRVNELARRTNSHWASLLSTLIVNGESTVCYDGQYFFDTDHSEGSSGSQSNDISVDISALPTVLHGSTTAPSVEEAVHAIMQGIQKIVGFVDNEGEPMNEDARSFLVMAHPDLAPYLQTAAAVGFLTGGANNPLLAQSDWRVSVAANARLTGWTSKFAIFRTDSDVKPFIRQEEFGVQVDAIAEGSELEFKERLHHYGVSASRNVAYGYWQDACLVTLV